MKKRKKSERQELIEALTAKHTGKVINIKRLMIILEAILKYQRSR